MHESELRGFARSRVGSEHVTQDIVQTTFLNAWTDARFDPRHPYARAWVFTTARRLILDWRRSEESNSVSLDDLSARAPERWLAGIAVGGARRSEDARSPGLDDRGGEEP